MSRRAFTLIEMLTVIAIIAILAGLLFPVIGMVGNARRVTETRSIMSATEAAISRYQQLNSGSYPCDSEAKSAYEADAAAGYPGIDGGADLLKPKYLPAVDADHFSTRGRHVRSGAIRDAWGTPLRYRPFIGYPEEPAPAQGVTPPYHIAQVNPNSYQLWSCGANKDDNVTPTVEDIQDDLANWGRVTLK